MTSADRQGTPFSYDVFLSHNQADKPRVRRLAERLRAAGLRVWFDEWVIQPGDDIYLAIERGLEAARVQVLCLSPAALGSEWVTLERSTVLFRNPTNSKRRFVPLLLSEADLPDAIGRFKYIDYRQEGDAAFEEILAACVPGTPRVKLAAIRTYVEKPGACYRFCIRLEGLNESNRVLGCSGLTVHIPTINSTELFAASQVEVRASFGQAISTYPHGQLISGFQPDGTWGKKPAQYLLIESVAEVWQPSSKLFLEMTVETPRPRLELLVRAWANLPGPNALAGPLGDPEWSSPLPRDQQGIPAHYQSVGID